MGRLYSRNACDGMLSYLRSQFYTFQTRNNQILVSQCVTSKIYYDSIELRRKGVIPYVFSWRPLKIYSRKKLRLSFCIIRAKYFFHQFVFYAQYKKYFFRKEITLRYAFSLKVYIRTDILKDPQEVGEKMYLKISNWTWTLSFRSL